MGTWGSSFQVCINKGKSGAVHCRSYSRGTVTDFPWELLEQLEVKMHASEGAEKS